MRGEVDPQSKMFSYFSPESRVPVDHPLRGIKAHADQVLTELTGEIDALYAEVGRPSIPPERLLKAQLLIALYTVRSDRLFCQMLDYNILFRWFLDMSLEDAGLDQSNFSRLRERLVATDLAQRFFDAIVRLARKEGLAVLRAPDGGRHADRGLGWSQELQAQGRTTAALRWSRWRGFSRYATHQRHACFHERPGGQVGA